MTVVSYCATRTAHISKQEEIVVTPAEIKTYRIIRRADMFIVQQAVEGAAATCTDVTGNWAEVTLDVHEDFHGAQTQKQRLEAQDTARLYHVIQDDEQKVDFDSEYPELANAIEYWFGEGINLSSEDSDVEPLEHSKMCRDRPYDGQDHTDYGVRGRYLVSDITFRDLRDCYVRAVCLSTGPGDWYDEAVKGDAADLCESDLFKLNWNHIDPVAVAQNLSCEVERMMGIFPNIHTTVRTIHPTEGLERDLHIKINGVDGATDQESMTACAADLMRRVEAGELVEFYVFANDVNGNHLTYDPVPCDDEPDPGQDNESD